MRGSSSVSLAVINLTPVVKAFNMRSKVSLAITRQACRSHCDLDKQIGRRWRQLLNYVSRFLHEVVKAIIDIRSVSLIGQPLPTSLSWILMYCISPILLTQGSAMVKAINMRWTSHWSPVSPISRPLPTSQALLCSRYTNPTTGSAFL